MNSETSETPTPIIDDGELDRIRSERLIQLERELTALRAELEAARKIIAVYAGHLDHCATSYDGPCTCGFSATIAQEKGDG